MRKRFMLSVLIGLTTILCQRAQAQQTKPAEELPKLEVGIESILTFPNSNGPTLPGVGARLTYNLNRHVALEGAAYFSPGNCQFCSGETTGFMTQGVFGVKAGQRFKKFGLFVKARPGVINLSRAEYDLVPTGSSKGFLAPFDENPFKLVNRSRTDFAVDVGGVLEIYPTKKFFLRFDGGLLIERIGSRNFHTFTGDPTTGVFRPLLIPVPGGTIGHGQFTSGVGFRF